MKSESEKYKEKLEAELAQFMVDAVCFVVAAVVFALVVCALAVVKQ